MEIIAGIIIGFIACAIIGIFAGFGEDNDLIERLHEEKPLPNEEKQQNRELRNDLDNAETRATEYARKLKAIENIIFKNGQGSIVDRFDKIKEVITSDQTNK
mgnify:CR=1 FL=1